MDEELARKIQKYSNRANQPLAAYQLAMVLKFVRIDVFLSEVPCDCNAGKLMAEAAVPRFPGYVERSDERHPQVRSLAGDAGWDVSDSEYPRRCSFSQA